MSIYDNISNIYILKIVNFEVQRVTAINILLTVSIHNLLMENSLSFCQILRGTQRQFSENICSEDDLTSGIFGTFVVIFLACRPLLGFSNI